MATDPAQLAEAVKQYQAAQRRQLEARTKDAPGDVEPAANASSEASPDAGLVASLIKQFGLGLDARLRRALYDRLARLERLHGQQVEMIIAEARSLAMSPTVRNKGNYFARAVCLKLREAGIV